MHNIILFHTHCGYRIQCFLVGREEIEAFVNAPLHLGYGWVLISLKIQHTNVTLRFWFPLTGILAQITHVQNLVLLLVTACLQEFIIYIL